MAVRHEHDPAATRRELAIARTADVCTELGRLGVTARVIGSLASGRFGPTSDIDLLITQCPRHLKYAIEGTIEEALRGLPFDVVYLDDIPEHKLDRFLKGAVDAGQLR
jgi:predicted nucleotidyltransferase